ncbi:MAG: hypothetical protein ACLQFR_17860 [Streptosporangiaceae bacterium]
MRSIEAGQVLSEAEADRIPAGAIRTGELSGANVESAKELAISVIVSRVAELVGCAT